MTGRSSTKRLLALGALIILWAGSPALGQDDAHGQGQYAQADIVNGSRVYQERCSACHGRNGDAMAGVNLRTGQFKTVVNDSDLVRIISTGIPDRGMPGSNLDATAMTGIVAYVRTMNNLDQKSVAVGDDGRGKMIVEGKGDCLTCHRIGGKGSRVAPDLSEIGALRSAGSLERTLTNPSSQMMPINRPVRAVTRDGKTITGRRLNEDTYTVQLMTDQEQLVSLTKSELRSYSILTTSTMPSYAGTLTPKEVADVLAYLLTLKGR